MIDMKCVLDAGARVGECPMWHAAQRRLYWVDSGAGTIHRFDPVTGTNETRTPPEAIGSFGFRQSSGLVVAARSGFGFYDFDADAYELVAPVRADEPKVMFNDGRVGPGGQFFAGTMGSPIRLGDHGQALYRFDPDGSVTLLVDGIGTSNGLAFSPDGKTLYHSDSLPDVQAIWAWDHEPATGAIANQRVFATTHDEPGRPDGATVDAEGFYWSAHVDGWALLRYAPDGTIAERIAMPVQKPSMPAFAGDKLDVLYVTSIGQGGTAPMTEGQPHKGGLFSLRPGTTGLPEPRFAG